MTRIKRRLAVAAVVVAAIIILPALFHAPLLNALAASLVRNDALRKAREALDRPPSA